MLQRDGQSLYLAGLDDVWCEKHDLTRTLTGIPPSAAVVALVHEPDFADVVAYDPRVLGIRDLPGWLVSHRLTTLHATPSLLRSLLGALEPGQLLPDLRLVTTCGEPVYGRDVAALRPHLAPGATFVNWSGASEIGSLAFFEVAAGAPLPDGVLPAGWPAPGKDVGIVDDAGDT